MAERYTIYRGDRVKMAITLRIDGSDLAIPEGSTVRLGFRGTHRTTLAPELIGGPWECSVDHSEADWTAGLVVVEITGAETAELPLRRACAIEARVSTDGESLTWVSDNVSVSIEDPVLPES